MEGLMLFLSVNWVSIAIIIMFGVLSYILLKNGFKQQVMVMCLFLVTRAEEIFGSGTGEIKYEWVITNVYDKLPKIIKFFVKESEVDDIIENAVDNLQEWLESQSK